MTAQALRPLPHRMAEPAVRVRVSILVAALVALAWVAVTLAGRPGGPFSPAELRDLSGVPVPPPQIGERFQPPAGSIDNLTGQLQELQRRVRDVQVPPGLVPPSEERR